MAISAAVYVCSCRKCANEPDRHVRSSRRLTIPSSSPPLSEPRSRLFLPSMDVVFWPFLMTHLLFPVTPVPPTLMVGRLVRSLTTAKMIFETGGQRVNCMMLPLLRCPL